MTRSELIDKISDSYPDLERRFIQRAVVTIFDKISDSLQEGSRVELRGFGTFTVSVRGGRKGRNPKTGTPVMIPPKHALLFKSGKDMRDKLNPED